MNKSLLFLFFMSSMLSVSTAQLVIVDFEESHPEFNVFGADAWTGDPLFDVIENPDATGLNTSDSVGQYLEPNIGEPWMGMFFKPEGGLDFTTNTELCAKVWVGDAATTLTFKAENNTDNVVVENPPITVGTASEWVEVCDEFAGTAIAGMTVETVVIFFNILSVPAEPLTHYFDDITQTGVTSTRDLEKVPFRIFPNPVVDRLYFESEARPHSITINDVSGRQIKADNQIANDYLEIGDLPEGMYFVSFMDENNKLMNTLKFAKH